MTGRFVIKGFGKGTAILVAALLLSPYLMSAQTVRKELPDLEFARFGLDKIVFLGDSAAFEKAFAKMDGALLTGSGNFRILHIGGSHVQGGTLTRQFRNNLLALGDGIDGGRGMVFPYTAAKTNTPSCYRSRYEGEWEATKNTTRDLPRRLGLTGMAVTTSDPAASVKIVLKARNATPADPDFRFDRLNVLGYASDGELFPVVVTNSGDTLAGVRNEAASCWSYMLPTPQDSVKVAVAGSGGDLTLTGIYLDNDSPGISVTGIGVNGAAVPSYLRCEDFERDLMMVKPDLVILAIGINDASGNNFSQDEFIARYKTLVKRIRLANPDCALLFVTNNDSFRRVRRRVYSVNRNGLEAQEAFFRLCQDCGGGYWDLFGIMGGLGSMKKWEEAGLARRDKIHFTDEGYAIIGDLLYNAFMEKYLEHLRRKSWLD
ncbi:MAG: hypothetical protein IJ840_05765 [Bacteroidales bacterium]|nr:hypothetical protein [Bacteroidales bacterium]